MQILEGSDTQLTFNITETNNGTTTNVDLTTYDKVTLFLQLTNGVIEIDGTVDNQATNQVTFDILSEQTANNCGAALADIRGLKGASKIRFNENTIQGAVLHSIKVPTWATE